MRVLHIITSLSTGGAQKALFNVLYGGLANQYENTLISLLDEVDYGKRIQDLGVPVYTLSMKKSLPNLGAIWRLRRIVRYYRPELLQGWMYHGNFVASLVGCLGSGKPGVAWNVRQSLYNLSGEKPVTRQVIRMNRFLSMRVNKILYNSYLSREQHEAFGFTRKQGRVIPNGFDTRRLCPDPEKGRALRYFFGISADDCIVGHVARFHPMKDHARFLRSAVRLLKDYPNIRFVIVGRNVGLDNPALTGIIPEIMLDRFIFLGEREDVNDIMQTMDIFCQSSWSEAFPNVVGEAMACQIPCVVTNVGDSAEIVGDTGVIVPPRNDEALVQGLLTMLSMTEEDRRSLGEEARSRIENNYDLPRIVEQYTALYDSLVANISG